ncbi:MAG: tRNA (adenosine(37)-N6)-threonylcarbamoyltransferase complex transferase subunit TsaD [Desulfobacterales bacterium]|nr:tRNA (adenosine(37)-N6)-threonylcarbamoyltransferase complex transferase subunit TsaD [Desulfobacterales bacterium]
MNILGIESSCDETAAAVVADGRRILSSVVASQVALHRPYGGVVPELASRSHIEAIAPVVDQALAEAGLGVNDIEGVSVTQGPGLVGCLLVGFCFAKAFAFARGVPWVGVDHLAAHLNSVQLIDDPPGFPLVALLASGGHTALYYLESLEHQVLLGQTRDDAAGEAYDKVAKMLGLGYPGGAAIERLAARGDARRIAFTRPYLDKAPFEFSFSGLKTAVYRHIQTQPRAAEKNVALVGGVAANGALRQSLNAAAGAKGIRVFVPPLTLCGDNAAMIAAVGHNALQAGSVSPLDADVYSRHRI